MVLVVVVLDEGIHTDRERPLMILQSKILAQHNFGTYVVLARILR